MPFQFLDHRSHGRLYTPLDGHGVGAGGDVLEAVVDDGLGQHHRSGRAVARGVVGLGGGFLEQLRAHVLEAVRQLDLFGDGYAVTADLRGAKGLVEHHVPALGAQGHLDGIRQGVDTRPEGLAGIFRIAKFLWGHPLSSLFVLPVYLARMSHRAVRLSSPGCRFP